MVERFVRDEEAAGSNPVTSTTLNSIQLIWMLFFHVCIIFSSGFEPAFNRAASRSHAEGVCFESCHLDLVAVDAVSLAATFSKSLLAHFVTAPLPTRPAALGSCRSLLQHVVDLDAVFSCLHKFLSGYPLAPQSFQSCPQISSEYFSKKCLTNHVPAYILYSIKFLNR